MKEVQPLVLLAPRVTRDSVAVWETALAAGWPVERLPGWRVPDRLKAAAAVDRRSVVLYAEPLFAEAVADQMGLALIEAPADWLTTVPLRWLRRKIGFTLLSRVRLENGPLFVKPAEGKVFEPQVFAKMEALPSVDQAGDIPVLTSTPVAWTLEVRCFVLDRRLMTMSPYWRNGALAQNGETGTWPFLEEEELGAQAFMSQLLADPDLDLPPACVVDIGVIANAGWAVIEANPCWGAGLYGCEPIAALHTIRRAIVWKDAIAEADVPWVAVRNRQPPP